MKNNKTTVPCDSFLWSRFRFRLEKYFTEDVPRDFNEWRKICFKHQVEQTLCHCNEEQHHVSVTPKIAIPKKDDNKGWRKLYSFLQGKSDNPETTRYKALIPINELSKQERLAFRLLGKSPKRIFYGSFKKNN